MSGRAHGPGALTEEGDVGGITAERCDVLAHPAQGERLIGQTEVGAPGEALTAEGFEVEESQGSEPVVEAHHHDSPRRQAGTVVPGNRARSAGEAAPVEPGHHR